MSYLFVCYHSSPKKFRFFISLGFGQEGPYKDRAGYDVIAASIGGLMHITGPKVRFCQKIGIFVQK